MKRLWILWLLMAEVCGADNLIEFNLGRGSPQGSIQIGGSEEPAGDRGRSWSADFLHQSQPRFYWGIGGGIFRSDDRTSGTFISNTISTLSSRSSSIFLLSRVDLGPPARFLPYAIFGTGWVKTSIKATASPTPIIDDSESTLGYIAGLGLDLSLTDTLFIGAETRYQSALERRFDLTPEGQALTGVGSVESKMRVFFLSLKAGIKY